MTDTKKITIAYSPDTDDAFMVQALMDQKISHPGYEFEFISGDIQELNAAAKKDIYDVTAISIAAYPSISDEYVMVPVGASIGDGFGPAIIVRRDSNINSVEDLEGKVIAVPGEQTSAYYSSTSLLPNFTPKFMLFSDIEQAVENGDVEAGILIHELQIECENETFRKIDDLGNLWAKKYEGLPLPLGTNAISRRLGNETIRDLIEIYRESIRYAFANRDEILKKAIDSANPGMTMEMGHKYIDMYVNERALDLDEPVKKGIRILYDNGFRHGLCKKMNESEYLFS
jgi:1,4-dihydroxy-6-naphthoate synthase